MGDGSGDSGATSEGEAGLQETAHWSERSAESSHLNPGQVSNVVVYGENGVVTNFKTISQSALDRLAKNYAWKAR